MPHPTRAGSAAAATSAALAVAGRVFGLHELVILATMGLSALVVSTVSILLAERRVVVERAVSPRRMHVGERARVVTSRRNDGSRPAPAAMVQDRVNGNRVAPFLLPAVRPRRTGTTERTAPAARRGVLGIGPATVTTTDPLGLMTRTDAEVDPVECLVLPRVLPLTSLPPTAGDSDEFTRQDARLLDTAHDEFGALRDFSPGDDVRHVHWPATARTGGPVVRQFEQAWHPNTVVVIDERSGRHDEDSYERALVAAASISHHAVRHGERVRVVGTGGLDSGPLTDRREHDGLMDRFALSRTSDRGTLADAVDVARQSSSRGRLVLVTGRLDPDDQRRIEREPARWDDVVTVLCLGGFPMPPPATIHTVGFSTDDEFISGWNHRAVEVLR